ncbi:MAG: peptidoglycan DD-metalloendopeptidase family protein [bacterium]|nr:peptidoglycan DD-metalloendopeptidase family protein [bacterium]
MNKAHWKRVFWLVSNGFLAVLVLVALIPPVRSANAGLFSFFDNLFGGQAGEPSYNSQNMPLLQAPQSSDPADAMAVGGAALNFVADSALLPVVGPMGSFADIDTYKLDQITTYTVHQGDNLSKIADMFGVSVNTIYWANNLKRGDLIKAGDVLVILPVTGIQYVVKKGDTIKSLAKKYNSDADEIIVFNNLPADGSLTVGDTIIIPNAEVAIPSASSGSSGSTASLRGSGGPELAGYFMRPIIGGRNSRATAANPHGLHGLNGADLASSCGTPVYASASGTVLVARSSGWNGGYGQYVVISHANGTQTVYAHFSKVLVSAGQYVAQGFNIGNIGSTGASTGCHVHFEVRGAKNPF